MKPQARAVAAMARQHLTVVHMLAAAAAEGPTVEALVDRDRRLDYGRYLACVAGFAHELQSLGASGQRVATLLGNSIEACVAAFGALAAGAQLVPLNPMLTASELEPILHDANVSVLVAHESMLPMAGQLAQASAVRHLIIVGEATRRLDHWQAGAIGLPPLPRPDALALLQYTGGTTGRAKGVELSHGAIAINVAQRETLLPGKQGDRVLCVMPLSHAYGMAMGLFLAPNCVGTLVLLPRYQGDTVLATIGREQIGVFPGSPTLFVGLMAHAGFAATDWSSVHTCYSGAAPLAGATLERWRDTVGAPIHEGYGLTEAGPVLAFNPLGGPVKPGSVGIAVPLTEIQIVDLPTGTQLLATDEAGEIRARGPQCMRGYRNQPQETAQALRDGWLYTGDIGRLDADGYLFIQDRKKDMAIVGGYNVYPREVEDVLFSHPDVVDAAVVGVPDGYRGEILVAHVVARKGAPHDPDPLLALCRLRLAKYKLPARVRFTDALPKTAANKTDKTTLRQIDMPEPRN